MSRFRCLGLLPQKMSRCGAPKNGFERPPLGIFFGKMPRGPDDADLKGSRQLHTMASDAFAPGQPCQIWTDFEPDGALAIKILADSRPVEFFVVGEGASPAKKAERLRVFLGALGLEGPPVYSGEKSHGDYPEAAGDEPPHTPLSAARWEDDRRPRVCYMLKPPESSWSSTGQTRPGRAPASKT